MTAAEGDSVAGPLGRSEAGDQEVAETPRAPESASRPALQVADSPRPHTRPASLLAWSLLTATFLALAIALKSGADAPSTWVVAVFVALLALSSRHEVVFPNEYAASADVAVILTAVVVFRSESPVVGPLLVAIFAGLVEPGQWKRRAFVRMAWNSGKTAMCALVAAASFAMTTQTLGQSASGYFGAVVVASVAAVLTDAAFSFALVLSLGQSTREAVRNIVEIDALQLPLALFGGCAGFLFTAVGWWAAVPPLVLLMFSAEIFQVQARIPKALLGAILFSVEVVVLCVIITQFAPIPKAPTVIGLAVLAVLFGCELAVDVAAAVPAVLGIAVVTAVLSAGGDQQAAFVGLLIGATTTAVAWSFANESRRTLGATAVAIAGAAGAGAGVLVEMFPASSREASAVAAIVALFAYSVAVVGLLAPSQLSCELVRLAWATPLWCLGISVALIIGQREGILQVTPLVLIGVGSLGMVWCGSAPWRSLSLSVRATTWRRRGRTAAFHASVALFVVLSLSMVLLRESERTLPAVMIAVTGDFAAAMALTATRQWRFLARTRRREMFTLLVASALAAVCGLLALGGSWMCVPFCLTAACCCEVSGRKSIRQSDALAHALRSGMSRPQ